MSFLTDIEEEFVTTEQWVVKTVANIASAVQSDIDAILKWVANNIGTITSDVQQVETILMPALQAAGVPTPAVLGAVALANSAVAALNAAAQDYTAGAGTAQTAIDAYHSFKTAQAHASMAVAAAVKAVPAGPAAPASGQAGT